MRLLTLTLEHFRNYTAQTVDFSPDPIHLFVGENGSGKTNLLESIGLLSLTKSCRDKDEQDMVQWTHPFYRVRADLQSDAGERLCMEIVSELAPRKRKAYFLNDVRTPVGGVPGRFPTVIFLPEDMTLFSGPPSERRRWLDQFLCQLSSVYFQDLSEYHKVLQQRNALLKRIKAGEEELSMLAVWDGELAVRAARITLARLELISALNLTFGAEVRRLGETWRAPVLHYERRTSAQTESALEQEYRTLLTQHQERDVILETTSIGPHREDWQVVCDERELSTFASRGQERTAILALLMLQVSYLELRRGEKPVILLDDAFSELDDTHQRALLGACREHQVIMTAVRVPPGEVHAELHTLPMQAHLQHHRA